MLGFDAMDLIKSYRAGADIDPKTLRAEMRVRVNAINSQLFTE
jgi:hypothetical protein